MEKPLRMNVGLNVHHLLTLGFSSDEDQTQSETKEGTGKNLRQLQSTICLKHENMSSTNNRHLLLTIFIFLNCYMGHGKHINMACR